MSKALKSAFARIYHSIPHPILEAAFQPSFTRTTLDDCIKEKVILARVRDDISQRGGHTTTCVLQQKWAEYTPAPTGDIAVMSDSNSLYRIPPADREYRDIATVLRISPNYQLATTNIFCGTSNYAGNTVSDLACQALSAQTGGSSLIPPTGQLYAGNVIRINPPQLVFYPWIVHLRLMYDDEFSSMDVSSIMPFVKVCEYATKAYIYNRLIIGIDSNMVIHGLELGVFKDIVSSYQDANEKYDELLIELGGAELYNPERTLYILKKMVPTK